MYSVDVAILIIFFYGDSEVGYNFTKVVEILMIAPDTQIGSQDPDLCGILVYLVADGNAPED